MSQNESSDLYTLIIKRFTTSNKQSFRLNSARKAQPAAGRQKIDRRVERIKRRQQIWQYAKAGKGKNVSRSFRNPEKEKQFVENRDHPDTDGFGSPDRTIPNQNRLSRHGIARIAKRSRFRRTPLPDETACRAKPEHDPDQRAAYPEGKKRDAENT